MNERLSDSTKSPKYKDFRASDILQNRQSLITLFHNLNLYSIYIEYTNIISLLLNIDDSE